MDADLRRNALLVALGVLAVCVVLFLVMGRNEYARDDAPADSAEVQQAMEVLSSIAADPASVPEHMSADATGQARNFVLDAAEAMSATESIDRMESGWFGRFLRITVTCPRPVAKPLVKTFYFRKEDGEMRITGLAA